MKSYIIVLIIALGIGCRDLGQDLGEPVHVVFRFESGLDDDSMLVELDGNQLFGARVFSGNSLGVVGLNFQLPMGPHNLRLSLPLEDAHGTLAFYVPNAKSMWIGVHYFRTTKQFAFSL
jgi:hypothetical protein